jgi:two-component system, NarL family, response regulator NreC
MPAHLRLASHPADALARSSVPIRVVLADDHAFLRRNLRLVLEREAAVELVAEADDLASALRRMDETRADVVLLEMTMSGGSGADAITRLREQAPDTPIVVLTAEDSPLFAQRALAAGAVGYVLEGRADDDLPAAIRAAAHGETFVSQPLGHAQRSHDPSPAKDRLTPREVEVLRLIALGHTSVEVAQRLQISARTVETHRAHIHRKLGVKSRAEVVRYALRNGMLRL